MEQFQSKYSKHILNNILIDNDFSFHLNHNNLSWNTYNLEPKKKMEYELNVCHDIDFRRKKLNFYFENYRSIDMQEKPFCHEDDIDFLINSNNANKQSLMSFLVRNTNSKIWTDEFFDKYMKISDLPFTLISLLNENTSISWSKKQIIKFKDYLDFKKLSANINVEIDLELFNLFEERWNIKHLCSNSAIAKDPKLEYAILNHQEVFWFNPKMDYNNLDKFDSRITYGGICTNTGIVWSLEKYDQYNENLDFWLIARFGTVAIDVIQKYDHLLDENREGGSKSIKGSDQFFSVKLFYNGWKNLLENKKTVINTFLIEYLTNKTTNIYKTIGDHRNGYFNIKTEENILNIIKNIDCSNVAITYEDFIKLNFLRTINKLILNDSIFPNWIYEKILKPYIIKDEKSFKWFFTQFLGIVQQREPN
jgi:hypothetical protein